MRTRWTFHELGELIAEIAHRKRRAAVARLRGVSPAVEPARKVYLSSCEQIARPFAADGFRYAKSGPHLSRDSEGLKHRVAFGSSHNNVSGEFVQLQVFASIRCAALGNWRSRQRYPLPGGDGLAGGNLGGLLPGGPFLVWNLAHPGRRADVVAEVIATIRAYALPYFDRLASVPAVAQRLKEGDVRGIRPETAIEFTLAFGDPRDAIAIGRRWLAAYPTVAMQYDEARSRYANPGFAPAAPRNLADQLARLAVSNGIEFA